MNTDNNNKYMVSEDTTKFVGLVEWFDRFLEEVREADFKLGTDFYTDIEWNGLAVRDKLLDLVKMSVDKNIASHADMI